jgi:galactokinase
MSLKERRRLIAEGFTRSYGSPPSLWVRAPGRVDLMGSHTDYNQGLVLTMAIDRDIWVAARPRQDCQVFIHSLNVNGKAAFELDDISKDDDLLWSNYIRGVASIFKSEGYDLKGFDGLVHSTIPVSSGLSSSAALEVATGVLFDILSNLKIEPVKLALLCQRAENQFVGVNCGILDQYSSVMGQDGCSLMLDCRDLTSQSFPINPNISVVICDTRAKRELNGTEYSDRRNQCELGVSILSNYYPFIRSLRDVGINQLSLHQANLSDVVYKRCHFIIEEIERVKMMSEALMTGDRQEISRLTHASYRGARDLFEISSSEMEVMMDVILSAPGIIGARQAGAGFGGCMVAFVEDNKIIDFSSYVIEAYTSVGKIQPFVYPVQPVAGAGPLIFTETNQNDTHGLLL